MRTQKFDPRDDRLQIKEDWALAELGAKVVVILEFFDKLKKNLQSEIHYYIIVCYCGF